MPVDDQTFATEEQLQGWCDRLGGAGLRGTGSPAHEAVIAWIEEELAGIPGFAVRSEPVEVLGWQPLPDGDLARAGRLEVDGAPVPVAGAVPYSRPVAQEGPLVVLPRAEPITAENAAGRVVVRDFPLIPVPYDALLGLADHASPDCEALRGRTWDRPGLADGFLDADLVAAGRAGAAGVVFAFDLPQEQVAGYFEPHRGTHYAVPAVFVGIEGRTPLVAAAGDDAATRIAVTAEVGPLATRDLFATLPGRSDERIVLVTHTDGATWVQEDGVAALLALAHHLAARPEAERHRTIELALTTAHLHISREGSVRHSKQLDAEYDDGTVAFAFPIEHLGARAVEPVPAPDGDGRRLELTDDAELVLWCVGPSAALRDAVVEAVERRGLERVLVLPGVGAPVAGQVPEIASFGGLGTPFHQHLVPTTSIITGPWSLWAPSFGAGAVDVARLRQQALAAGDVVLALDAVGREEIAGDYLAHRTARAAGAPTAVEPEPPEVAPT